MKKYPEHDKLNERRRCKDVLKDFLEWLESNSIRLDFDDCCFPFLDDRTPSNLICEFLEVDRKQLFVEKWDMADADLPANGEGSE